jgi:hypothetical protein
MEIPVSRPHSPARVGTPSADSAATRTPTTRQLALLVGIAVVYAVIFAVIPRSGFWVNDNGLKFLQVEAIEQSRFLDYSLPWPGQSIDPEFRFSPVQAPFGQVSDANLYASYSPFFALLSSIPHRLLGSPGLYVLPLLGTLFTLAAVRRMAVLLSPTQASEHAIGVAAVLVTAFASPIWFYSFTFWEHTPALAFCTWALVVCLAESDTPARRAALLAGALAGLAIYFRTDAYLFAIVLGAVFFAARRRNWRSGVAYLAALLGVLTPLWVFHWIATGNPLGLHMTAQGWGSFDVATHLDERLRVLTNILVNAHGNPQLSAAIVLPYLVLVYLTLRRRETAWLAVPALISVCIGGSIALHGHLVAQQPREWLILANGLFAVSPILIMAFISTSATGAGQVPADDAQATNATPRTARDLLLSALFLTVVLYVALVPETNTYGIHWGCRFLLIVYCILCALVAPPLLALWERSGAYRIATRGLVAATLLLSVMIQVYSLELLRTRRHYSSELASQVSAMKADVIVTGIWDLPQDLAEVFYTRPIFLVRTRDEFASLLPRLRASGYETALFINELRPEDLRPRDATVVPPNARGGPPLALRVRSLDGPKPGAPEQAATTSSKLPTSN